MNNFSLRKLISLRQNLHRYPDLSGEEHETARRVADFVGACHPDEILEQLGGAGLGFIYHGEQEGDVVMLRAELDALPISEHGQFPHCSAREGISHKCGHDGHMAILMGVAAELGKRKLRRGKLVLLFQPAEETGEGANRVLADPRFQQLIPDYVFALHNQPGLPERAIAVKEQSITIASTGMRISLLGKTAHAMAPENGISPVAAVKEIHTRIQELHYPDRTAENFSLITTVGLFVGAEDYGVAPANGDIYLTVRAYKNETLNALLEQIGRVAEAVARTEQLQLSISYKESFSASVNDRQCTEIVKQAALDNHLQLIVLERCLGFSEDFGRLIEVARKGGALFLLGAGEEKPNLHTPDYDFNDNIIQTGISMFSTLVEKLLGLQDAAEIKGSCR